MTTSLWIVGVGGVGRETLDVALAAGVEVAGFLDDDPPDHTVRGLRVIEPGAAPRDARYIVGIASPDARRRLAEALDHAGLHPVTLVHPLAIVAPEVDLGDGVLVMGGAHVSSSVTLGAHSQVHYNATVGHDATVEPFATVYPGANVSGGVVLEEGATVGSAACVLQGRRVGRDAFVGAGAVVTRDVPDRVTVVGSPARPRSTERRASDSPT